jgi:subtilisin-like proprotein convertase family protein
MARLLLALALVASCSAAALPSATAVASSPPTPRNCGAPILAAPANLTPTVLPANGVATSTIVVSGLAPHIHDVDVLTNLPHTESGEIDMTVTSPAGTVVTLTTDNGGSFDNVFAGTRWDDSAAPGGVPTATAVAVTGNVQIHPYSSGVTASPLAPEEALGAFIGEDPNGTWTITVSDDGTNGVGNLLSWGLDIASLAATPPPASASSYTQTPGLAISSGAASVVTDEIEAFGEPDYLRNVEVTTNISHTNMSDLQIALTSPAGTTVFLSTGVIAPTGATSSADNVFAGTVWNDDANPGGLVPYATNAGLASDHPFANLTLASPLAPSEAFAAFRGENANGKWKLTVADQFAGEGGAFNSWNLLLTSGQCPPPDTVIDSGPAEGSTVASGDANFTYSGSPAGVASGFECSLDGAAFTSCPGGRSLTGLSNGPHTFRVAAIANDTDPSPATRTWTVNVPAAPAPGPGGGGGGGGGSTPPPTGSGGGGGGGGSTPNPPPTVITSPSVSGFAISPKQPRAGETITFKWRLSKAGSVTVKIDRRVKKKFKRVGSAKRSAKAGAGSLKLKGKIAGRKLVAGSYRATITATVAGAAKPSAVKTVRFTIAKVK